MHMLQQRLRLEEGAGAVAAATAGIAGPLPRALSGDAGHKRTNTTTRTPISGPGTDDRRQLPSKQEPKDPVSQWCGYDEQVGFITALTRLNADGLMLDLAETLERESAVRFVVTAVTVAGTYADGKGFLNAYAYPAEETQNTMFVLELGGDGVSVDVYAPQLEVRTTDPQSEAAVRLGKGSGWIDTLPTVACDTSRLGFPPASPGGSDAAPTGDWGLVPADAGAAGVNASASSPWGEAWNDSSIVPPMPGPTAAPAKPRVVIDGGALVRSGFYVAPTVVSDAMSYRLRSVKAFANNLDVTVEYMMPDGLPLALGYSLVKLRERPMVPRGADSRLLYFTTDYKDLGSHDPVPKELPGETIDRTRSNIWRYDLSALPGEQIRIHVDPTVPARWRPHFRKGVEAWNEAFALVGRPSAVRAVLPEDADWPEDYDIADARFNTISWSITDEVVSMGVAKVDPRSGEILKSDITMSDGWVRTWLGDMDLLSNLTHTFDFSGGFRHESLANGGRVASRRGSIRAAAAHEGITARASSRPSLLELHRELQRELAPGQGAPVKGTWGQKVSLMSLTAGTPLTSAELEEVLGQGLRHVVSHETGHILGLRHNFKGTLSISYACTRDPACTAVHGLSTSVMDYVPVNLPALGGQGPDVHIFSPVLGAYDKLAIKYGYMAASDAVPGRDSSTVPELLAVLNEAEAYPTCYDADRSLGEDPGCAADDLTDDPVRYFEEYMERLVLVQRYLLNSSVLPGVTFSHYGEAVYLVLNLAFGAAKNAATWLGGVSNSYAVRKKDGRQPVARRPVPVETQRRALRLLLRALRPKEAGLLPPPEAFPFLVRGDIDRVETLDLDHYARAMTSRLLDSALGPSRLAQMHEQSSLAPWGAGAPAGMACDEYLAALVGGVMGGGLAASPSSDWDAQRGLVRNLAALYADAENSSGSVPAEVGALALYHLRRIHGEADSARLRDAAASPASGQLLRMHLLSLQQQLAAAVCPGGAGQPCPALNSAAAPHRSGLAAARLLAALTLAAAAAVF